MPIVVADLIATLQVDQTRLTTGLAQAKAAFNEMGGAASTSGQALRQVAPIYREIEAETARLTALLEGQSKAAADVAARYTQIEAPIQAHLVALKEEVAAELEARRAAEAQTAALAKEGEAAAASTISLKAFGTAATTAGRALTLGLTAPLLALGAAALKSSLDLAHANDTIRQQTGATGTALQGLEASFRRVSTQVPQDFGEVAKAVALVAQRTHETGPALEALSRTELNLARVTGTDLATNISKAGQLFKQYGIDVKDQVPALDILFRAHQQTGDGFDKLQAAMVQFAPTFKSLGLGFADTAALLGTFEQRTGNVSKVAQGLNIVLTKWAKEGITDAHKEMGNLIAQVQKAPSVMQALQIATQAGFAGRAGQDFVNIVRTSGFEFEKLTQTILTGKDTINKAADATVHLDGQMRELGKAVALAIQPLGDLLARQLSKVTEEAKAATPALKGLADAVAGQSRAAKGWEEALLGIGIAIGPVLFGIGKIALASANLKLVFAAGRGVVARFFSVEVFAVALPIVAIGAVALAVTALITNFHGLGDDWVSGWKIIGNTIRGVAEAIPHFFENVWSSLEQGPIGLLERWKSDFAVLGQQSRAAYDQAFKKEGQARSIAAAPAGIAAGEAEIKGAIGASGLAAGEAELRSTLRSAPLGGGAGGFHGGGASPNVKELTADQQKQLQLTNEIIGKKEELAVLRAGENNALGQVIARYHEINPEEEKHLANLIEQIKAREKLNTANERAQQVLAGLKAKLAEVDQQLAGGAKTKAPEAAIRVSGASPAEQQAITATQKQLDAAQAKLKEKQKEDQAAATEQKKLGDQIAASYQASEKGITELTGATAKEVTAADLLNKAIARHDPVLIGAGRGAVAAAAQFAQLTEQHKAAVAQFEATLKVVGELTAAEDHQAQVAAALGGAGKELTDVQKALVDAYDSGDPALIAWAEHLVVVAKEQDDLMAAQKEWVTLFDRISNGLEQASLQTAKAGGTSRELALAQQTLNAAWVEGDDDLINLAAAWVDAQKAADAATEVHKEATKQQTELQKALTKTADFVQNEFVKAFDNLRKGGLKNVFQSLLTDLDDFLFQWAAKIAASQLTQALFGAAGLPQGQPGAGGGSTGILGGLASLAGGLFGGGGSSAGDIVSAIGGGTGAAGVVPSAADLAGLAGGAVQAGNFDTLTGVMGQSEGGFDAASILASVLGSSGGAFQTGGVVMGGQPSFVGERGPELFVPSQTGQVYSHGSPQTQGALRGGGATSVQMIVNVKDAPSFQKSQPQIAQDMSRLLERHRARQGY